jgi:Flp pilus assembly pilin Flp
MVRNRKGQSILEYTLILGAVIAVIVAVLLGNSGIKDNIEGAYNKAGEAIGNQVDNLDQGIFGDN